MIIVNVSCSFKFGRPELGEKKQVVEKDCC